MKKDYRNPLVGLAAQAIDAFGWLVWSWSDPRHIDPLKIKKIAVIKFDRIGDSLLATPVLEALVKMYPHAELHAVVAPWNREVFEASPFVRRTHVFENAKDVHGSFLDQLSGSGEAVGLGKLIADLAPDIGVDLQGSPAIVLALKKAKVPVRVGFGPKVLSFFLTHKAKYSDRAHQSEIYLSLARALGYDGGGHAPRLAVSPAMQLKAAKVFAEFKLGKFVVFHLGSGRSYRRWPLAYFVRLSGLFLAKYPGWKIVVIGGGEDAPLAEELRRQVGHTGRLVDFVGRLTISGTHELLRHAKAFVGSESGPMHIASAAGTPSVVMMNSWSGIERWQPLGDRKQILWRNASHTCSGPACGKDPCPRMAAITVDEVFETLTSILGGPMRISAGSSKKRKTAKTPKKIPRTSNRSRRKK